MKSKTPLTNKIDKSCSFYTWEKHMKIMRKHARNLEIKLEETLVESNNECQRLRAIIEGYKEGFNEEGESSREACCSEYKKELLNRIKELEKELECGFNENKKLVREIWKLKYCCDIGISPALGWEQAEIAWKDNYPHNF